MDARKCNTCSSRSATLFCGCSGKAYLLCSNCVGPHTLLQGSHKISMYRHMLFREGSLICDECAFASAESICSCSIPFKKYCEGCRVSHINKSPYNPHSLLPIDAWKVIKDNADFPELAKDINKLALVKQYLFANLQRIDTFKVHFQKACRNLISEIEIFERRVMEQAGVVRDNLENHIRSVCNELEEKLFDREYHSGWEIVNYIRTQPIEVLEQTLSMFSFEISESSCLDFFKGTISIQSIVQGFESMSLGTVPIIKGSKLVLFTLPNLNRSEYTLSIDTQATKDTSFVFSDPNTVIGVSGNYAFELSIVQYVFTQLPPLIYYRNQPGLYVFENWVYAFGGFYSGALLTCEKYLFNSEKWVNIGHMLTARYSFNPVRLLKHIWLIGGIGSNGNIEKYDTVLSTFAPIEFRLPSADKTVCFEVGTSIIAFHKQQKYKFDGTESTVAVYPNKSSANNLCCNLSVRYEDSIYFLELSNRAVLYCFTASNLEVSKVLEEPY